LNGGFFLSSACGTVFITNQSINQKIKDNTTNLNENIFSSSFLFPFPFLFPFFLSLGRQSYTDLTWAWILLLNAAVCLYARKIDEPQTFDAYMYMRIGQKPPSGVLQSQP